MKILSNLIMILVTIIAIIDKCKADFVKYGLYSIEWNETSADGSLAVGIDPFGLSISISNGYAVIGSAARTVYIYERSSNGIWNLAQTLQHSTGVFSVGISNEYTIISSGAALIYKRASNGTWYLAQRIEGTETDGSFLGEAVAISNGYAIIGASGEDIGNNNDAGAAYIYEKASNESWNLAQRFEGTQAGAAFGNFVAISNGYAIIGASRENIGNNNNAGAAYIYERASNGIWSLAQRLEGTQANGWFGSMVAISNNGYAIIGAERQNNNIGAAYLYERASNGTWNLVLSLLKGSFVSISNVHIIIGSFSEDNNNGAVYIYRRDINGVWEFIQTFGPPLPPANPQRRFGLTVAISNGFLLIGSIYNTYVYDGTKGLSECNSDYVQYGLYSIKWRETSPDQTFQVPPLDANFPTYTSLGISNEYTIIGSSGTVNIYEKSSDGIWNLAQRLEGASGTGNAFGVSVGITNEYAIIGRPGQSNGGINYVGAAFIYKRASNGTWNLEQQLESTQVDKRGISVAISNDYAIVGSYRENLGNLFITGAAYIYERASNGIWNLVHRLVGDSQFYDDFGGSVAISNEFAIVGADGVDIGNNNNAGAAYIYKRASNGTWYLVQRLDGTQNNGQFGLSVAISNGYAIIGALQEDTGTNIRTGAAYIYERTSNGIWNLVQRVHGSGQTDSYFGAKVSISNIHAIIGVPFEDNNNGTVYTYRRNINGTWEFDQKFKSPSNVNNYRYGHSVAILDGYIFIGNKKESVYFYNGTNGLSECPSS